MRIALYQAGGTPGDVAGNMAAVREAALEAAAREAELVIFPEAFLTGYNLGPRVAELAEPVDGPTILELRRVAVDSGIAILCGYCERAGELIHNAAVLIDRGGQVLLNYRKTHLYGSVDRACFAPGDEFALASLGELRIGVLICYDIEFPEPARRLALAGAQLIAVPTSLMSPFEWVSQILVPARAAENQVFVAYANRIGAEGDLRYVGQSCVAGPDGSRIVAAGEDEEVLLVAEIDPEGIDRARAVHSYLDERRPGLYGPLTRA
jgi:predicted amidohydrolase